MTMQELNIGVGPDFVIRVGQEILYHKVELLVAVQNHKPYTKTLAHQSMMQLIREIKSASSVIQIKNTMNLKWHHAPLPSGTLHGAAGQIAVNYHCPDVLPPIQFMNMNDDFKRLCRKYLSSIYNC